MKIITEKSVRGLFKNLETGRHERFFRYVALDVNWTVMGTHPLAGMYHDRETFIRSTFKRLNKVLKEGVRLRIAHVIVDGETVRLLNLRRSQQR